MKFLALALLVSGSPAADGPDAAAAFEKLKALVGTWESTRPDGQKSTARIELMAGGSALVEHYDGMGGEMLTVYHLDGDRLLLTHYCMAGNQPRMQLKSFDPSKAELSFDFLDATGLTDPSSGHMRTAWFQLQGTDRYQTKWQFYENGKVTFDETESYQRVK